MTIRRAIFLTLLGLAFSLDAQQKPKGRFNLFPPLKKGGGEVRISVAEGGKLEAQKDEYTIAEGGVVVLYQDVKLQGDKMTYNEKTKDVVAEGHVVIDQGPTRVTAHHAIYNLESKTGTFFNATGTMDPAMYFSGDRIEKVDADTYRLTNGVFTSCDLDRPAWSFHVASAEVTVDDYAHMRNLSLRAHNVPIFWTPRLIWPTKRERTQGFLIPRVQLSQSFGNRMEMGYFVPFGDSADATLYANLNTEGYNGAGVSIRYLPSQNIKLGELDAFTVRDVEGNKQQWKFQYQHSQDNLPGGFRGVVDIQDYSDLNFFRRWDSDSYLLTLSNIYSSAYLTKNRPNYSLNILTDRREIVLGNEILPGTPVLKQRFEQLPSLQFRMYPQRLARMPVYFSLESSASHLRTSGLFNTPSADYYRGDIFPTLSLQLRTPAWFSIKPQIAVRQTYYSDSLAPVSTVPVIPPETSQESLSRFYAQGQVEVVGPTFSKVFNREAGGFTKFKHVIEPRFRYIYTTNVSDQERVIRFDTVDSPFLPIVRDSVEYSVTQRLIGKEKGTNPSPREVLSFSLRQTVSLSKPFSTTTRGGFLGSSPPLDEHKFTPLIASLHANPYQSVTLDISTTFGNISHQVDQVSISANLVGTGESAGKYLSTTWFSSYRQPGQVSAGSSQLRINGGSAFWRDRIHADVQLNFDAKAREFLEQRYILGGTASCYGLTLEYRRYQMYDPIKREEWSLGGAITLKNVGTIGTR